MRQAFLSPRINPVVVGTARWLMPFILENMLGGLRVEIADADLAKLRAYQNKRMLLLPNHPTGEEPYVMFELSRRMNEVFNFVAARELFDWEHGFRGWMMRRVGVYSVIRGASDRESMMTSKRILMEGRHRLVIFIEGEISRENDTLIPFEPGVIQLALWAQDGLVKEATKAGKPEDFEPVYIAPVAIKYFYEQGSDASVAQALSDLERAVGIDNTEKGFYKRIRLIGERVMSVQEKYLNIEPAPEHSLTERVETVKDRLLRKMELFLDLQPPEGASTLQRLREVRNTMDRQLHQYDDTEEFSDYEKSMILHLRLTLREFYQDLDRVVHFLTYDEAYLRDYPTQERLIEMIRRLEKEVYGAARLNHPRTAVVKVGDIVSLKDQYPEYESNKKTYARTVAERLEDNVEAMLRSMTRP